jgi:hypothetical protein
MSTGAAQIGDRPTEGICMIWRLIVLLLLGLSPPAFAETSYIFKEPSCPQIICSSAWMIYIDGEIRPNEGDILEQEIVERGISSYSTVYLNSPGGSLYGGIELGRVIRKYGFSTGLGEAPVSKDDYGSSGVCFSACTLAYLGGKFRYFHDNSLFGVHRFYSEQPPHDAEATAQIASAAIITYLGEVGVDPNFFVEMTKASSDSIRTLSEAQLVKMGVVNNGIGSTSWSIQANKGSAETSFLYLRGERATEYGVNKAIFFCSSSGKNMALHVIFDPQGRAQEALSMRALSLALDDQRFELTEYLKGNVEEVNGWINATFDLSKHHWTMIKRSENIGVMFQFSYEAPIFLGFEGMPLKEARSIILGIESACPAAYSNTAQASPVRPSSIAFQRFQDQDFFGSDLTSQGFKGVTLNQCESICTNSRLCLAYSYVNRLSWCFPKSSAGLPVAKAGVISGVKQ